MTNTDQVSWWPDSAVTQAGEKRHYHYPFQKSSPEFRAAIILHVPFSSGRLSCQHARTHTRRAVPPFPMCPPKWKSSRARGPGSRDVSAKLAREIPNHGGMLG